jgi:hypothetical protein
MTHTPTPWSRLGVKIGTDTQFIASTQPNENRGTTQTDHDNAEFIVHAVNCHAELVEVLKMVLEDVNGNRPIQNSTINKIEQVLAKEEGKA